MRVPLLALLLAAVGSAQDAGDPQSRMSELRMILELQRRLSEAARRRQEEGRLRAAVGSASAAVKEAKRSEAARAEVAGSLTEVVGKAADVGRAMQAATEALTPETLAAQVTAARRETEAIRRSLPHAIRKTAALLTEVARVEDESAKLAVEVTKVRDALNRLRMRTKREPPEPLPRRPIPGWTREDPTLVMPEVDVGGEARIEYPAQTARARLVELQRQHRSGRRPEQNVQCGPETVQWVVPCATSKGCSADVTLTHWWYQWHQSRKKGCGVFHGFTRLQYGGAADDQLQDGIDSFRATSLSGMYDRYQAEFGGAAAAALLLPNTVLAWLGEVGPRGQWILLLQAPALLVRVPSPVHAAVHKAGSGWADVSPTAALLPAADWVQVLAGWAAGLDDVNGTGASALAASHRAFSASVLNVSAVARIEPLVANSSDPDGEGMTAPGWDLDSTLSPYWVIPNRQRSASGIATELLSGMVQEYIRANPGEKAELNAEHVCGSACLPVATVSRSTTFPSFLRDGPG